ncbi:hypothetical protein C8R44DRAFT_888822 [Mycena epipterygia]|nr:hypothetical protein C8R44DRAFT_888822 [Mycena epipterygia]
MPSPHLTNDNDLDLDPICHEISRQDLQSSRRPYAKMRGSPPSPSVTSRRDTAAPAERSHLSPESTSTSTSDAGSMHGYGRNMLCASLASPSDTVSIQEESETVTGDLLSDFEHSLWVQNRWDPSLSRRHWDINRCVE